MKTSATTGSTMAAISLLRSAGVFPSNRAMTFKLAHAVAAFASTEISSRDFHCAAALARRKYAAMSRRRLTSAPRDGAVVCAAGGDIGPSGFAGKPGLVVAATGEPAFESETP